MPADTRARPPRLVIAPRYPAQLLAVALLVAATVGLSRGITAAAPAGGLAIAAMVMTALVHEGAHAAAAALLGVRVHALTLRGALTASIRRDRVRPGPSAARAEVLICLAGPAASLVLIAGSASALLVGVSGAAAVAAWCLLGANLIAVTGSLPGVPSSDGTRALRAWRDHPTP